MATPSLVQPLLALWGAPTAAAAAQANQVQSEETFRFLALPELWIVGLVLLPAVVLLAWWSYGGLQRLEPRARVGLSVLRGLAIAACLVALFQPAFEIVRYTKTQAQVHVLVDDSASMQRHDTYPDGGQHAALAEAAGTADLAQSTRAELVRRVLEKPGGLLEQLRQHHDVRLFRFSRKPLPIRDLSELTARGPRTHIGDALELHLAAAGSADLDAVILVSDGRSNAGVPYADAAAKYRAAGLPIHTIGVGDPNPPRNIRITGPPGPKEALRKEEVAFDVTVSAEGLAGRAVTVTLHGARDGGASIPLATATATLAEDGVPVKVRLYRAFEDAGDWTLRFEVSSVPEETNLEDNTDVRFLRVNDQKIRVLYVDYKPRWDFQYIRNALLRVDPSIEVQTFLFDANRSYPQVSSEGLPSLTDIPRTREQMFQYTVILIGDVPPELLAPTEEKVHEWLKLLVEFVEFGGGVGFQFGDIAMPERYRGTPIEDLLPVVLEDAVTLQDLSLDRTQSFVPRLETPSQPHDITLLRREPEMNAQLWHEGFPPLIVYYPVQQPKAGAQVLLRHPTDRNKYGNRVIAAAGFYPRGRTFWLGTDETFRWRKPYAEKYHDTFWRNVVRWLAGGRLQRRDDRVEMRVDKVIVETGEQVRVSLTVHDRDYQPASANEFTIFFRRAEGEMDKRTLQALPGEPGSFQGTFTMHDPGSVSIMAFAHDDPRAEVLAREDVLVKIPDREMARSSQDRETLEQIAEASKDGRYVFLADAQRLGEQFENRKRPQQEVDRSTRPAWDSWWTLLLIVGLLATEWTLRKRVRLV